MSKCPPKGWEKEKRGYTLSDELGLI